MRLPTAAAPLSRRKKSQDLVAATWRTEDAIVIVTGTDVGAGADLGIGEGIGTDPETGTGDTDGADLDPETGIGTNTGGAAAETAGELQLFELSFAHLIIFFPPDALGPGQALEESKKSELVERVETASK